MFYFWRKSYGHTKKSPLCYSLVYILPWCTFFVNVWYSPVYSVCGSLVCTVCWDTVCTGTLFAFLLQKPLAAPPYRRSASPLDIPFATPLQPSSPTPLYAPFATSSMHRLLYCARRVLRLCIHRFLLPCKHALPWDPACSVCSSLYTQFATPCVHRPLPPVFGVCYSVYTPPVSTFYYLT